MLYVRRLSEISSYTFADNLHASKQEFNDIFVNIFGTYSLYRATHAIGTFIISFFRDNQIQNFRRVRSTQTKPTLPELFYICGW